MQAAGEIFFVSLLLLLPPCFQGKFCEWKFFLQACVQNYGRTKNKKKKIDTKKKSGRKKDMETRMNMLHVPKK